MHTVWMRQASTEVASFESSSMNSLSLASIQTRVSLRRPTRACCTPALLQRCWSGTPSPDTTTSLAGSSERWAENKIRSKRLVVSNIFTTLHDPQNPRISDCLKMKKHIDNVKMESQTALTPWPIRQLWSLTATVKAALAVDVNPEVVLAFALETDDVERNCRHLFPSKILGLGLDHLWALFLLISPMRNLLTALFFCPFLPLMALFIRA